MLIEPFWTICLFFIYFLNVPCIAIYEIKFLEGISFLLSWESLQETGRLTPPWGQCQLDRKQAAELHVVVSTVHFHPFVKGECIEQ